MARRKAQTYGSALPLRARGGRLSARQSRRWSAPGPLPPEVGFAASERQLAPSRTAPGSRPRARRRRTSSRLHERLMMRPSSRRGQCSVSGGWRAGISLLPPLQEKSGLGLPLSVVLAVDAIEAGGVAEHLAGSSEASLTAETK